MGVALFNSRSRGFSLASLGVLVTAIAVPLGVRSWSTRYADRLASSIATQISAIAKLGAVPAEVEAIEDELDIAALVGAGAVPDAPSESALESMPALSASKGSKQRAKVHGSRGVRVSSAQVLALAARRAMPKAVPVKASAQHPAGLQLRGVSGLGLGMQDGDVLTEAAGQKATSLAVVVGVVLAARGRQAPEISGRFYRGGVPYTIVVEQPYPKAALPAESPAGNPG